jgi:hypothetical protein
VLGIGLMVVLLEIVGRTLRRSFFCRIWAEASEITIEE